MRHHRDSERVQRLGCGLLAQLAGSFHEPAVLASTLGAQQLAYEQVVTYTDSVEGIGFLSAVFTWDNPPIPVEYHNSPPSCKRYAHPAESKECLGDQRLKWPEAKTRR